MPRHRIQTKLRALLGLAGIAGVACAPLGLLGCEPKSAGDDGGSAAEAGPTPTDHADGEPSPDETASGESGDAASAATDGADGTEGTGDGAEAGEAAPDPNARPEPPPDYGLMKPTVPAPDPNELKIHALAGYEVVAVHAEPNIDSKKLGFLRYGQRMKVTERKGTDGCPKGWYGLPEGGFACASKGLVVERDKPPYMHAPPPPPKLDEPYPYEWSYVRAWNSPMWWKIPSSGELARANEERAIREAERKGEPPPGSEPPPAPAGTAPAAAPPAGGDAGAGDTSGGAGDKPDLTALPKPDGAGNEATPPEPKPEPKPEPAAPPADADPDPGDAETAEPPPKLPLNPQHPWLEKGFFISLAGTVREGSQSYWQTARGGYVSQKDAYKYEAKDYQGQELGDEITFPVGFVMAKNGTTLYELQDDGSLKGGKKLEKRDFLDLTEETEIKGKAYMMTADGMLVRKDHIRMPTLQPLPKGLAAYDRWIDVSLNDQILVAYEGTRPVYTTLVSTGRKGSEEEPFETPTGRWRIYSKQVTSNMDGATATDGNYAIQDVPWVMYFEGSYALHGAFWHRSFGYVRSHGCVNLGPSDARWLFFWTTPFLPSGWHGVHATDQSPGTTVIVRD